MNMLFSLDNKIAQGQAYWKVRLVSGEEISEETADWLEAIARSERRKEIAEISLCTPQGEVAFAISQPCTAFQFKRGMRALFSGEHIAEAHIIGRLNNREGDCIACVWDVKEQRLYRDVHTNVKRFGAWREGLAAPGALSCEVIGVVIDG